MYALNIANSKYFVEIYNEIFHLAINCESLKTNKNLPRDINQCNINYFTNSCQFSIYL